MISVILITLLPFLLAYFIPYFSFKRFKANQAGHKYELWIWLLILFTPLIFSKLLIASLTASEGIEIEMISNCHWNRIIKCSGPSIISLFSLQAFYTEAEGHL